MSFAAFSGKVSIFRLNAVFCFRHENGTDETYNCSGKEKEINRIVCLNRKCQGTGTDRIGFENPSCNILIR